CGVEGSKASVEIVVPFHTSVFSIPIVFGENWAHLRPSDNHNAALMGKLYTERAIKHLEEVRQLLTKKLYEESTLEEINLMGVSLKPVVEALSLSHPSQLNVLSSLLVRFAGYVIFPLFRFSNVIASSQTPGIEHSEFE